MQTLDTAWRAYRAAIARNGGAGESLIDYANRHAVADALRHDAVALEMELAATDAPFARAQIFEQMALLVDQIAKSRANATPAEIDAFDQRLRTFQAHRGRELEPGVVFRGTGLGFTYPRGRFHLRGVDLVLRKGEITGVLGENGNGKTTLFRIVTGRVRQTEGEIEYPDLAERKPGIIDWPSVKRDIAYVPQELPPLYGTMEENLRFTAASHGQTDDENDLAVTYIATRLHLTDYLDCRWHQLSGGFKLRFALARALVSQPKLLVLDEPLANLDFLSQLTVLRDISELCRSFRNPIAVLISSQHLFEIEAVADNILFLREGQVVFNGPTEAVGRDVRQSIFELGTELDANDLRERISAPDIVSMSHNGLSYVIRAQVGLDAGTFLARLIEKGVPVEYFRDISQSVKQLFETDLPRVSEPV